MYVFSLNMRGAQLFTCEAVRTVQEGHSELLGFHLFLSSRDVYGIQETRCLELSFRIKILRWQIYGFNICDYMVSLCGRFVPTKSLIKIEPMDVT
jgi:hypothetical protein